MTTPLLRTLLTHYALRITHYSYTSTFSPGAGTLTV